eukprot:2809946-Pyramimonas_sp.AAC.1
MNMNFWRSARRFLGSALGPPPWRADRAGGGVGGAASADPRSPRAAPQVSVYGVFISSRSKKTARTPR